MFFSRLRRRFTRHSPLTRPVTRLALVSGIILLLAYFALPGLLLAKNVLTGPVNFLSFVWPQQTRLRENDGRTNLLLLGIGGGNHDGPDLTDSMMVVSFDQNSATAAALISLPRDIYLDSLSDKINAAYSQGKSQKPGGGLLLAKSVVSQVTGLPIHYAFVIDFDGFSKAIDSLGGVDIKVENTFDDNEYPVYGKENDTCGGDLTFKCRYESLHFEAGPMHMDGPTTLKFVRSRKALGIEGSDFARVKRQQLVVEAVKAKVLSTSTLLQPQKLNDLYSTFKSHIDTDLNQNETALLIKLGLKLKNYQPRNIVLDETLFDNPPIDERGWILLPKDGTFEAIHKFLKLGSSGPSN